MAPPFNFNIAFTIAGIKRGGQYPHDFAPYVSACEVLSGGRKEFRRRLTLADGAVHTPAGATLDQDVWIIDQLAVLAQTVGTGARSSFLLSSGAADGNTELDLFLTAMYELKLENILPGTKKATDIEMDYTGLARGACRSAVETIRRWKIQGKLAEWAEEDQLLDAAAEKARTEPS